MKKYIISFNYNELTTYYVHHPVWYKYYRAGRYRKRLGYHLSCYCNMAHIFIKRKNVRFIMNDIALRYKRKPIMIQIN